MVREPPLTLYSPSPGLFSSLPVELLQEVARLLDRQSLLALLSTNSTIRAELAPLAFGTLTLSNQWIKHFEYRTIAHAVTALVVASSAHQTVPVAFAQLPQVLPTLHNLRRVDLKIWGLFSPELYLAIRAHPAIRELKIARKMKGPVWRPSQSYPGVPKCRLEYVEVPRSIIEDLFQTGSPSVETVHTLVVVGQPLFRQLNQLGPYPSLRRLTLLEQANNRYNDVFWQFLKANPWLSQIELASMEYWQPDLEYRTSLPQVDLQSITRLSGPFFLLDPLIRASKFTLQSLDIRDVLKVPRYTETVAPSSKGSEFQATLSLALSTLRLHELSISINGQDLSYMFLVSALEAHATSEGLGLLRTLRISIKNNIDHHSLGEVLNAVCSTLVGRVSTYCSVGISTACHETCRTGVYRYIGNQYSTLSGPDPVLRTGAGVAEAMTEIIPAITTWANMRSSIRIDRIDVLGPHGLRWFSFRPLADDAQKWHVKITPNGGRVCSDIDTYQLERKVRERYKWVFPLFENETVIEIGKETIFWKEMFEPDPSRFL